MLSIRNDTPINFAHTKNKKKQLEKTTFGTPEDRSTLQIFYFIIYIYIYIYILQTVEIKQKKYIIYI